MTLQMLNRVTIKLSLYILFESKIC